MGLRNPFKLRFTVSGHSNYLLARHRHVIDSILELQTPLSFIYCQAIAAIKSKAIRLCYAENEKSEKEIHRLRMLRDGSKKILKRY